MTALTGESIRSVLDYQPETGRFFWKPRHFSTFANANKNAASVWNNRFAGHETFLEIDKDGYRKPKVFGRSIRAHRVAWLHYYGRLPEEIIDHINGDRSDNRINNLREVDAAGNNRNCRLAKNNTSGVNGVTVTKFGSYRATIKVNNQTIYLGKFKTLAEASDARARANRNFGFDETHGLARPAAFGGSA